MYENIDARTWNSIISMVNNNRSRDEAAKYLSGEKLDLFDSMTKELANMRKDNPTAAFWPVESDW